MAKYKGSIFAGIQPLDYTLSQLYEMSRTRRGNNLISANSNLRFQLMWNGLKDNQAPNKNSFNINSNKGDIINVIFDVYTTTISPPPSDINNWTLTASIKKTRDIANQSYIAGAPALNNQRFTVDISSICQDVLSYSLVPIKKGTWQSSIYGGMNGGTTKQDNVTSSISNYNVSPNGAFRHVWVYATPEVIIANGTIKKVTQNPLQFNKICVINSLAQYELDNPYYWSKFLIREYSANTDNPRGFMSFCPNFTVQSGASLFPFAKNVRTDEEAEWLYWYQYKLFNSAYSSNYASKTRIKITTYSSVGVAQNECYLSDFNSNLTTEVRNNLVVFKQLQSVLCAQNVSPAYINLFAQDDAGNVITNQIDSSTQYYKASLRYTTAEDNLVTNGNFATNTNWTNSGSNGWAINTSTGAMTGTSATSYVFQNIGTVSGKTYTFTADVELTSGQLVIQTFGSQDLAFNVTATGRKFYTATFTETDSNVNFGLAAQGSFTGSIYSLSVQESPATLRATEYRYFNIDRETANTPFGFVRFHWLNRVGGVDSYTAKRNVAEKLSIEKNTVEIKSADRTWIQNQYTNATSETLHDPSNYVSNTMRGGNLYKGGREVLSVSANKNNSVYTEPLNKQSADWLQEIMTSPNVWIEMDTDATKRNNTDNPYQRPSTKGYIPVIINNADIDILNQESGLVTFNIEYTLAHKVQTQRN